MNKEFVAYEQALALKELGFDEECLAYYHTTLSSSDVDLVLRKTQNKFYHLIRMPEHFDILAPLKQQVFRWFREKKLHNTFPSIIQTRNWATVYRILEWHPGNDSTSITTSDYYDTYEEAENACIDKLIELAKQEDNGN
jgi:hypothetical protein